MFSVHHDCNHKLCSFFLMIQNPSNFFSGVFFFFLPREFVIKVLAFAFAFL